MQIASPRELDELLDDLRAVNDDHQWVEAKRSRSSIPQDLWKTLSAFANSELGGLILLGVDEREGFAVSGVENAGTQTDALQGLCGRMDPSIFPAINTIVHSEGVVIAAVIWPLPRGRRPCSFPDRGSVHTTAYKRVGDSNALMDESEIAEMLAVRQDHDESRRPAPEGASLEPTAAARFVSAVQPTGSPHDHDTVLRRWRIVDDNIHPTLAGFLALGDNPQGTTSLARVACKRIPTPDDPSGARMASSHIEGTVGEILDGVMGWFRLELPTVQVVVDTQVRDVPDVPFEVLREMTSNALIHRSLSEGLSAKQISINVNSTAVTVTSPGGLARGVNRNELGLQGMSTPRNYALTRIAHSLQTPQGGRIIENQASGIPAMDNACRAANLMPVLFRVEPARFVAVAIRSSIANMRPEDPHHRWGQLDVGQRRVLAALVMIDRVRRSDLMSSVADTEMDVWLAARTMGAGTSPERAAKLLDELAADAWIRSEDRPTRTVWTLIGQSDSGRQPSREIAQDGAPTPSLPGRTSATQRRQRLILSQIGSSEEGLRSADTIVDVGWRQKKRYFMQLVDAGLIHTTSEAEHDPTRRYLLTDAGRRALDDER